MTGALDVIRRERVGAFFNLGSPLFGARKKEMIAFAIKNRLPYMANILLPASRAAAGSFVITIGRAAMIRGAGRPASWAASRSPGTM